LLHSTLLYNSIIFTLPLFFFFLIRNTQLHFITINIPPSWTRTSSERFSI
jgi:hypothetical protein